MMTRRAISRQEENKLQLALQELKISRELCAQLNSERDSNEKELLEVIQCNGKLKAELSMLHVKYDDIKEECNRVQLLVITFDQCSIEYEKTLRRSTALERELRDAHQQISELEEVAHYLTINHTHSLFEELFDTALLLVIAAPQSPCVTIDLTNDTLPTQRLKNCSNNKLKRLKLTDLLRKRKN